MQTMRLVVLTTAVLVGGAVSLLDTQTGNHLWQVNADLIRRPICMRISLHPSFQPEVT